MKKASVKVTILGIILNAFLFVIKISVGLLSNSLALISDAVNSLTDIIASVAIYFAVKMSNDEADKKHPFGHYRLQPLAAFVVAIFTGIFGFEIFKMAVHSIVHPDIATITWVTISVPIITMAIKGFMYFYFKVEGRRSNSPAISAMAVDAKNDIFVSIIVLSAIVGTWFDVRYLDSAAALIISIFIFKAGYDLAIQNMDYLLGKAPPAKLVSKIKGIVKNVNGIEGINDVRAHYVGSMIHIEIHIEVAKRTTTLRSHAIAKEAGQKVEAIEEVDKAFIHVDPV